MMLAFLAPAALKLFFGKMLTNARSDLGKISPKGWLIIALVAAAIAGFFVHQHTAHKALKAQYAAGYAQAIADVKAEQARVDASARAGKAKIEKAATTITQKKEAHLAKTVTDIAGDARALRLRGAPRAEPVRLSGGALHVVPGAAGGGDGAAQGEVSGLAQIPWIPLVDHGEQCDVDRAKLEALQGWIREQAQLHNGGNDGK